MQATTQGAGLGSSRARLLLAQHLTIGCLAVALAFNAATPFITPDPPWLSDVPIVFAIMILLIIIGLLAPDLEREAMRSNLHPRLA